MNGGAFMRRGLKSGDIWIFGIVAVLLLSILFAFTSNRQASDTLDVYTGEETMQNTYVEPDQKKPDIDTVIYVDNANNFSLNIPAEWTEVTQDGFETFIHQASGSSVQIQVLPYDPVLNDMTYELSSKMVSNNGYIFKNFIWKSNAQCEVLYQDYQSSTYDYIEEIYWDRTKVIKLVCIFKDTYYTQLQPYYDTIINSFAWERTDPIPEGYYLFYDSVWNFETGVPDGWSLGSTDSSIYYGDEASGSYVLITAEPYEGNISAMSASDVANYMSSGRENYMMNNYQIGDNHAIAYSTYTKENVQYQSYDALFSNGQYIYCMTCSYEAGMLDPSVMETCVGLFRTF